MLILDASSVDRNPRSMPEAGTDITVSFRFRTSAAGTFTTRYSIGSSTPYKFANATGGNGREVRIGSRQAPSPSGYNDTLQVRSTGPAGDQANLVIDLQVQESGGAPQTASVVVFILHNAVAAFRATNDLTQAEVAQQAGVSRSTISRLEQGLTPSDDTREAVEKMLQETLPDATS